MISSSASHRDTETRRVKCTKYTQEHFLNGIDARSLFLPQHDTAALDDLLDTLWRLRQRALLSLEMQMHAHHESLLCETGFVAAMTYFKSLSKEIRRATMESPSFRIWMHRSYSKQLVGLDGVNEDVLKNHLVEFWRILNQAVQQKSSPEQESAFCLIQRYDVDPLVREVAPPSYVFDGLDEKRQRDRNSPYTIAFFSEVLRAVMLRIEHVWPELAAVIPKFVKTIIHLPDIEARSCSAQRFAGVVLLSSSDETLLMVEESLVHECGHQILYCVMEIDSLIRPGTKGSFILPWSGAERDAYGYFHAVYIYLLLALLLEREVAHGRDKQEAAMRLGEILRGLERSLADFEDFDFFTPGGERFFRGMSTLGAALISRNRARILAS